MIPVAMIVLLGAIPKIWYSLPLIVVVSLCYGATRHEHLKEITIFAVKTFTWVAGFMGAIFLIVLASGFWI